MKSICSILKHLAQVVADWTVEDSSLFVSKIFFMIHSRICSFVPVSSGQEIGLIEADMLCVEGVEMAVIEVKFNGCLLTLGPR